MSYGHPGDGWNPPQPVRGPQWPPYSPPTQPLPGQGYQGPPAGYGPGPYGPPPVPYGWYGPVMTDQRDRAGMAVLAWILTVIFFLYFLPWAIAATRGKSNAGIIGLVNFLTGWTIIGWIVSLVMACQAHNRVSVNTWQGGIHTLVSPREQKGPGRRAFCLPEDLRRQPGRGPVVGLS